MEKQNYGNKEWLRYHLLIVALGIEVKSPQRGTSEDL